MSGKLEYWRADNMWAAEGRPDGNLGQETLSLSEEQKTRIFITDWRYEKRRNDGVHYYGSHGRVLQNSGSSPLYILLTGDLSMKTFFMHKMMGELASFVVLQPGAKASIRNDIREVTLVLPKA